MLITLDLESDIPIYEQLKTEIIIGIASGSIIAGEKLPSVRSLASDIGINLHTVSKAYNQLKDEGYLLIHRQKGVVVHPDGPPKMNEQDINNLKTVLKPIIADSICRSMDQQQFIQLIQSIYHDLKVGEK